VLTIQIGSEADVGCESFIQGLTKYYPRVSQGLAKLKGAVWTWVELGCIMPTLWVGVGIRGKGSRFVWFGGLFLCYITRFLAFFVPCKRKRQAKVFVYSRKCVILLQETIKQT
jgi:hypothetical protein